jgi:hypothetical protein
VDLALDMKGAVSVTGLLLIHSNVTINDTKGPEGNNDLYKAVVTLSEVVLFA